MRREALSLDGKWDFSFCGDAIVPLDSVDEWRSCMVPAPWQAQFDDLRERNGRAWYRRTVELPRGWAGEPIFLCFGAVNYHARILVNGREVAEHEGGYLPFEIEIGEALRPGSNDLAIHVT